MQPNVHFLEFSESVSPVNDHDRFHVLWQLDTNNINNAPQRKPSSESNEEWKGIFEGDLVVFPSLLSGAGEFEAVRFVGPKTTQLSADGNGEEEEVLPLLTCGIEYPEFPTLIVSMAEERGVSLRDLYEIPFNAILESEPPKISLLDVFGRDEVGYKEYWDDPPVARRRRPPSGDPWKFSLRECVWIKTLDGNSLAGKREKDTGGGEL